MIDLLVPLLLSISTGIFTASETGLVSIERVVILRARREGKKWAERLDDFLAHPERFFSTILVCENFFIVIASTLYARFFVGVMGQSGVVISMVTMSLFSLFFGQFIPKSIALAHPANTMAAFSNVVYYIEIVTYPIVMVYAGIARQIARLFRSGSTESIRRLDIVHAMSEYEEEASRLASRLFNFSRRKVGEVMIPLGAAFACPRGRELECIAANPGRIYTRVPIYERKRNEIVGIFNIKDYLYSGTIDLREPLLVGADDRCMTIFLMMKQKGEHMAIVTDPGGQVGIVTLEDLIEELVGEIRDEK